MDRFDCVIVLGSQIGVNEAGEMSLAFHTEMKAKAAGIAFQQKVASQFILSGGYNFGVCYDLILKVPVFGTPNSDRKTDFSDEAKRKAKHFRSESSVMAQFMRKQYKVSPWAYTLEEDSATTKENAEFCARILQDMYSEKTKVGILALLYHMERALKEFQTEFAKIGDQFEAVPLFAENLLVYEDLDWIKRICEYYNVPKAGKQWDVEKIRELLSARQSLVSFLL